jgi:hypothetical protein
MKTLEYVPVIILLSVFYLSGCYSFYSGIYRNNPEVIVIYYPPEPLSPPEPSPCIDCYKPTPEPINSPVAGPNPPIKYRPVQPVRNIPEEKADERRPLGSIDSRDNSGIRNENPRRR